MANTIDASSLAPALKRIYTEKKIASLLFDDAPGMALIPKSTELGGDLKAYPVRVSEAALGSSSVTQAATNSTHASAIPNLAVFHIQPVEVHAWSTIDHKTMMKARNDKMAFLRAGQLAAEDAMLDIRKQLGHAFYRAGWGRIGVIAASGVSGATITLTNIDDTVMFVKGRQVVFSATESGDLLRDGGNSLVVQSVDRDAGTVTFTANVSTVSGATSGDSVFIKGNRDNSATPSRLCIAGLDAWLPSSAPSSSDSFFNVNRSSDSLLSGVKVVGSLTAIEDSLIEGALRVATRGGKLDVFLVSYSTFGSIIKNASAQVTRNQRVEEKNVGLGFEACTIMTPRGPVKVVPDYFCPDGVAYGLQLKTWELGSMGPLVSQFNMDGNDSIRQASALGIELRYVSYPQLVCTAPGFNVRVALS